MGATQSNQVLAIMFANDNKGKLVYERDTDSFWRYEDFYWKCCDRNALTAELSKLVQAHDKENRLTMSKLEDILRQAAFVVDAVDSLNEEWVAFDDVSVSLRTFETAEHSPERVATVRMRHKYGTAADAPIFRKYLADTCKTEDGQFDPLMESRLQEIAGYILSPYRKAEYCFFLYGNGANGKSPFIDILAAIVGKERTSHSELSVLTNSAFEASKLVAKKLNCSTEIDDRTINGAMFKKMVSGEMISAQRKFGPPFDLQVKAALLVSMNNMVTFSDMGYSFLRRTVIVPFHNKVDLSRRDLFLSQRIIDGELPYVVQWALEGLKRLMANNWVLTSNEAGDKALIEFEEASSSPIEWLNESVVSDPDWYIPASDLYSHYHSWCSKNGRKAVSARKFGHEVTRKLKNSFTVRHKGKIMKAYRCKAKEGGPESFLNQF